MRVIQKKRSKSSIERANEAIAAVVAVVFMLHYFSCRDIVRGNACRYLTQHLAIYWRDENCLRNKK